MAASFAVSPWAICSSIGGVVPRSARVTERPSTVAIEAPAFAAAAGWAGATVTLGFGVDFAFAWASAKPGETSRASASAPETTERRDIGFPHEGAKPRGGRPLDGSPCRDGPKAWSGIGLPARGPTLQNPVFRNLLR